MASANVNPLLSIQKTYTHFSCSCWEIERQSFIKPEDRKFSVTCQTANAPNFCNSLFLRCLQLQQLLPSPLSKLPFFGFLEFLS